MMSNMQEMRARGATIVLVANAGDTETPAQADEVLWVPSLPSNAELFMPAVNVVPLQIFAYALAKAKGFDVDKPSNLAKTVTVGRGGPGGAKAPRRQGAKCGLCGGLWTCRRRACRPHSAAQSTLHERAGISVAEAQFAGPRVDDRDAGPAGIGHRLETTESIGDFRRTCVGVVEYPAGLKAEYLEADAQHVLAASVAVDLLCARMSGEALDFDRGAWLDGGEVREVRNKATSGFIDYPYFDLWLEPDASTTRCHQQQRLGVAPRRTDETAPIGDQSKSSNPAARGRRRAEAIDVGQQGFVPFRWATSVRAAQCTIERGLDGVRTDESSEIAQRPGR